MSVSFFSVIVIHYQLWLYNGSDLTRNLRENRHFVRFYPVINEKQEPNTNRHLARSVTFEAVISEVLLYLILLENWSTFHIFSDCQKYIIGICAKIGVHVHPLHLQILLPWLRLIPENSLISRIGNIWENEHHYTEWYILMKMSYRMAYKSVQKAQNGADWHKLSTE